MAHIAIKRADLDALQDELEIISDKKFAGRIEEGLADVEEGRVYGFEAFEGALKNKLQKVNKEGKVRIWLRLRE